MNPAGFSSKLQYLLPLARLKIPLYLTAFGRYACNRYCGVRRAPDCYNQPCSALEGSYNFLGPDWLWL
jgi:hypothetical protein